MLKQIERLLDHYLRWPCPVGFHASEVQKLITKEKKAAGYALMKKLKMLRCAYITNSVPLIINCKSDFYGHLYCNLESSNLNAEDAQKMELFFIIRTLQACGMVSLISGTLGARLKNALGSLPPQGLNDFYNDLLDIMEEASKIEDVRKARKEHKDKIACICKELIDNSETSDISIECEGFPADFSEYRNPSVGFRIQSMHLKWIPTPLRVSNIKAYPYPMPIHVPKTTAQQMLWEIVHNGLAGRQGEPHRVLITSGDGTLQYILTGYVGMMHNKKQMGDLQEVDVRFFVLPAHELDTLSCYIARRDHFYDAMIYRPLTNPLPFIPFIEHVNNKNFLAELTGGSGDVIRMREEAIPCMLLRKQIENYILEGNCLLSITIFNCEGWYTDRGKSFHCTIPFLIRADIALSVGTVVTKHKSASHCQSIPRKSTTSFDNQEMFQNLVSKSTLKASVIYKPVDRNGIEVPERREDYTLLALSAINIPNPSELRLNCDPCNASLNLCIVKSDVNSRNGVKTLDDLVRFMVTCHAKFIVVEAEKPFDVLLDGLAFGPFMRIRLSACPDPLNMANSLKFPIMSYWPTQMSRHGHL